MLTFLDPSSPEWDRAWSALAAHPVNAGIPSDRTVAECPDTGEVWQYMGTEVHPVGTVDIVTTGDGGRWVDGWPARMLTRGASGRYHVFRHRSHPSLPYNGSVGSYHLRATVRVPAIDIGTTP